MGNSSKQSTRKRQGIFILAALALLAIFAVRLKIIVDGADYALFLSRWEERKAAIDLVCDDTDRAVAINQDWRVFDYTGQLAVIIGAMDAHDDGYTALFNADMEILSGRVVFDGEAPLEPLAFSRVLRLIAENERGETTFPYTHISGREEDAWVYFRWIPTGEDRFTQLLVVDAMAYFTPDSAPISELAALCVALLAVSALALAVVIAIIIPSGGRGEVVSRE